MAEATIENVVGLYVRLRNDKDRVVAKAKAETEELDKKMAVIEAHLLLLMEKDGVDSFKTSAGKAWGETAIVKGCSLIWHLQIYIRSDATEL